MMQAALSAVLANNAHDLTSALLSQQGNQEPETERVVDAVVPGTGATLLHIAANRGHLSCVSALLEAGANIEALDATGGTALFAAVGGGGPMASAHHSVVTKLLANGANPNVRDGEGLLPLHEAANNGDDSTLKLLLLAKSESGASVCLNNTKLAEMGNTQVNATASAGVQMTPLHFAAAGAAQRPDLYRALKLPVNACAEEIRKQYHRLALKFHPDKQQIVSENISSSMDDAKANENSKEHFKLIAGAYSILSDSESRDAFDHAHERCAELLLAHGADISLCTTHKNTPRSAFDLALHFRQWGVARAIQRHALQQSFEQQQQQQQQQKQDPKQQHVEEEEPKQPGHLLGTITVTPSDTSEELLTIDISRYIPTDDRKRTLLHHVIAAFVPAPWILSLLLNNDSNTSEPVLVVSALLTASDVDGETPFHLACGMGRADVVGSILDLLCGLKSGKSAASKVIECSNSVGTNALMLAVRSGMISVVNALLESGVELDMQYTDEQGLNVLDLAKNLCDYDISSGGDESECGDAKQIVYALEKAGAVVSSVVKVSELSGIVSLGEVDDAELFAAFTRG